MKNEMEMSCDKSRGSAPLSSLADASTLGESPKEDNERKKERKKERGETQRDGREGVKGRRGGGGGCNFLRSLQKAPPSVCLSQRPHAPVKSTSQ